MRKLTRSIILLLVVAIIFFGYTSWLNISAIYNLSLTGTDKDLDTLVGFKGVAMSSSTWKNAIAAMLEKTGSGDIEKFNIYDPSALTALFAETQSKMNNVTITLRGFMAENSLANSLLTPFKMILVGGVFASFVPLVKKLFFGTIIGIKNYIKVRQTNILYNYQATIKWTQDLKVVLEKGNLDEIKAKFSSYDGLKFKPKFLDVLMEKVGAGLIKEKDLTMYAPSVDVIVDSINEMYKKERMAKINGRPNEKFFDLKRGYEYTSLGSKYNIAYLKALPTPKDSKEAINWKVFSLEMYKFITFMIIAIIPTVIISGIISGVVSASTNGLNSSLSTLITSSTAMFIFTAISVSLHAFSVFTKKEYKNFKQKLVKPAITYYSLIFLMFTITIPTGFIGLSNVGDITGVGSSSQIWVWFSALAYLTLTSCLLLYVISTLMDGFTSVSGLNKRLFIDGIVLPLSVWLISTISSIVTIALPNYWNNVKTTLATINTLSIFGFWSYLSISSVLLNNLYLPTHKLKEITATIAKK